MFSFVTVRIFSQVLLLRSSGSACISQATQCDALKTVPFFSDPSDAMHEFAGDSDPG